VNATVDFRESPILTTYNAIQGQGVDSIDALRDRYSVDEIRQLAEDRTASSHSYTVGATKHSMKPSSSPAMLRSRIG